MQNEADNSLELGKVLLTKIGEELAPICGSKPVDGFFDYVREKWKTQGYIIDDGAEPTNKTTDLPQGDDVNAEGKPSK